MATVYERFVKLGLAHSNPILQLAGEHIKRLFSYVPFVKVNEQQGNKIYLVNNYEERITSRIDFELLQWTKRKPSPRERFDTIQWWKHYKGLPR